VEVQHKICSQNKVGHGETNPFGSRYLLFQPSGNQTDRTDVICKSHVLVSQPLSAIQRHSGGSVDSDIFIIRVCFIVSCSSAQLERSSIVNLASEEGAKAYGDLKDSFSAFSGIPEFPRLCLEATNVVACPPCRLVGHSLAQLSTAKSRTPSAS
jgi:hypothetical protein